MTDSNIEDGTAQAVPENTGNGQLMEEPSLQESVEAAVQEPDFSIGEKVALITSWLAPLLVYLSAIAPGVTAGDSSEFIVAVNRLSLAHPPGYPLYMLLLKLFTSLPINIGPDPLAFKGNLFSAVIMAASCGILYRLFRILTGSAAPAIAATLVFAVSRTVWKFSVVTEVYSLHILLIALILYGLALARENKNPLGLVITAFGFGLGLAHHHTILFILPLIIVLWPRKAFEGKIPIIGIAVGVVLPLLLYFFLPIFASHTPGYAEKGFTTGDFIDTISRAEYRQRAAIQTLPPDQLIGSKDILVRSISFVGKQMSWFLAILGIAGWFMAPPGKRLWAGMFGATAVIWILAISFLSRGSPLGMPFNYLRSVDEFMLPVNLFLAGGIGWILSPVALHLESKSDFMETEGQNFVSGKFIPLVILLLFCVIPFFLYIVNSKYSTMTHHTFVQDQSRNILEQVGEGGVLISSGDETYQFEYLQQVRGLRQDVEIVDYPFSFQVGDQTLSAPESLALYLQSNLEDRPCTFSFGDAASSIEILKNKALRLDGVAYTLVDRVDDQPYFQVGHPNIWTTYQLRNLDKRTLFNLPDDIYDYEGLRPVIVPDDFEYEAFDRYINGLNASFAWLIDNGWDFDPSTPWLDNYSKMLTVARDSIDYPRPPG